MRGNLRQYVRLFVTAMLGGERGGGNHCMCPVERADCGFHLDFAGPFGVTARMHNAAPWLFGQQGIRANRLQPRLGRAQRVPNFLLGNFRRLIAEEL